MKKGLIILFLIFSSQFSFSQTIEVNAKLDTSVLRLGEQTQLHLSVKYKADRPLKIIFPFIGDTIIKQVEVVSKTKIDTTVPDKNDLTTFLQSQTFIITSFDSGFFAIPPFKFIINDTALETEPLLLQVNTLHIDTSQAIKDIKPPFTEPYHWKEFLPYIVWGLVSLAVIAIVIYLIYRWKKKKKNIPVEEKKVKIPAHIIALQNLEKLKEEKLWQQGKVKLYHSTISDILRVYIEDRFKIPTLEQTTDEILQSFRSSVIDKESLERLRQVLILSDLVKFAKEQPLPNENEMSLSNAFDFVNGTKRDYEELVKDINNEKGKIN